MDQPSLNTSKMCQFYENTGQTYLSPTMFNGHYSLSPYNMSSVSTNELSCSLISSTTFDLIDHNAINAEWMNHAANNSYSSGDNTSEPGVIDNNMSVAWSNTSSANHLKLVDVTANKPNKKRRSNKSNYKHVPHREKPVHLVARRNARERKRVQAVNSAFVRLRKCVPVENRNKRLSKVKTLHRAIEYIGALEKILTETDQLESSESIEGGSETGLHRSLVSGAIDQNTQFDNKSLTSLGGPVYLTGQSMAGLCAQSSLMTGANGTYISNGTHPKYVLKGSLY